MRVMPLLAVVVAIGLSSIILAGFGLNFSDQTQLEDDLASESGENRTVEPQQDTGFLSFVGGAVDQLDELFSLITGLPGALNNLGLPWPAAQALGIGIQISIAIALIQIAIQYTIR